MTRLNRSTNIFVDATDGARILKLKVAIQWLASTLQGCTGHCAAVAVAALYWLGQLPSLNRLVRYEGAQVARLTAPLFQATLLVFLAWKLKVADCPDTRSKPAVDVCEP